MSGLRSRNKGKRGERQVAKMFKKYLGIGAARGAQYRGGPESPDVILNEVPGVHVEVKYTESFQVWAAMDQARKDAGHSVPIVIYRKNGKPWLVIHEFEDWLEIISQLSFAMSEEV